VLILGDGSTVTHGILQDRSKQTCDTPTAEDAAKAKALINVMMQDWFFLALYRSNDPKVRAVEQSSHPGLLPFPYKRQ
jgi:hypothetical protein